MPAAASSRFASASLGVAAGRRDRRARSAVPSPAGAANAAPNRPIAAIAVTARVGSSCTHPAIGLQFGATFIGGVITDSA